ncbi:Biopolymer transport protein ExbD [compost metagenome]
MLVLLIMFMVTTPLMQQGIEVDLPKTSASGVEVNDEPFVLVINANQTMTAAKQKIAMPDLRTKIKAIFETRKNKQVYIQADRKVDYGFVAEAMAEIRAAGIFNIGLVTQPKDQ